MAIAQTGHTCIRLGQSFAPKLTSKVEELDPQKVDPLRSLANGRNRPILAGRSLYEIGFGSAYSYRFWRDGWLVVAMSQFVVMPRHNHVTKHRYAE